MEEKEMSFLEHLEELRWHIMRSVLALAVLFGLAMYFSKEIFHYIIFAPGRPDFVTFKWLCAAGEKLHIEGMCITSIPMKIQSRFLMGQFTMQMTSSAVIALIAGFPYIAWELWRFVKPGLYNNEKRGSRGAVFASSSLFAIGVSFGYFVLCPMSIAFLANYSISDMISNEFDITSYVSTIAILVFGCGILFQLPVVIYFLTRIGILTPVFMRYYRRHAAVIILIIGALVTPTADPFT
ncbi:MAG: twin-arginine translocase subunit TatC, partial [Candidatus Nephrothrix sp. EaCA]